MKLDLCLQLGFDSELEVKFWNVQFHFKLNPNPSGFEPEKDTEKLAGTTKFIISFPLNPQSSIKT